ncbi:hypothetical protein [Actinotalea sp.]|uniref:hypothetical protein n=1 Tax=Actinotalea sp. TaxID=1872145 RepID=UPI002C48D51E|nr:hypothetical protein [Actinotalea sp.]HQY32974.1 hypothetical protein [Actinotalea sp.]HRA51320.1 hypothetical protein [Actinotalea sp.]
MSDHVGGAASLVRIVARARRGTTVPGIAAGLGLAPDLAALMVDELGRLGVLEVAERTVASCAGCAPAVGPGCAGCPLARGPRVS